MNWVNRGRWLALHSNLLEKVVGVLVGAEVVRDEIVQPLAHCLLGHRLVGLRLGGAPTRHKAGHDAHQ